MSPKNIALLSGILLFSGSVLAHSDNTTTDGNNMHTTSPPASAKPSAHEGRTPAIRMPDERNPEAPIKGENSFTEDQAKERISEAGYSNVSNLILDDDGVWRGTATKDGRRVNVALDYQGNVVGK